MRDFATLRRQHLAAAMVLARWLTGRLEWPTGGPVAWRGRRSPELGSTRAGITFLVRPDGYLAARARPDKLQIVLGCLQELSRAEIGKSGDNVLDQRAAGGLGARVVS